MDKLLYIAMSGAKQNLVSQGTRANNLANVSTTAFHADFEQARSMPVFGPYHPSRAYALSERPGTDFNHGTLIDTGRELDVAIKGEGWFAVQAKDGEEAYSRNGELHIDATGVLRNNSGYAVLGEGGPVTIPPAEKIEIAQDGTITIRGQGQGPEALIQVNRIKLVNPDLTLLEKGLDGLFRRRDGLLQQPAAEVRVVSGFVEASNVNPVHELTSYLSLARQYEMQVKMMKTADENAEALRGLLQVS